jgi:hypothetical protein
MKYKWYFIVALFLLPIVAFSQEDDLLRKDISEILSKDDFERIEQFIMDKGDRKTFSQKYNLNPHYSFEDLDVYLNPVSQWIISNNIGDYNVMVIHDETGYYHMILENGKVYVYNPYRLDLECLANEILKKYIPKLKSLIGK